MRLRPPLAVVLSYIRTKIVWEWVGEFKHNLTLTPMTFLRAAQSDPTHQEMGTWATCPCPLPIHYSMYVCVVETGSQCHRICMYIVLSSLRKVLRFGPTDLDLRS